MEMKNVKEIFLGGPEEITIANTSKSFTSSSIYSSYSFFDVYSTSQSNLGQADILKINFTITSNQGSPYIESMLTYYDETGSIKRPEFTINGTTNYEITTKLTGTVDSNTWEVLLIQQYDSYGTGNDIRVQLAKTGTNFLDIYVKNQIASSMFTLTINSIKLINSTSLGVKKITNANGDIIWGSYEEFPYRRLEYINFNGAEYINTNKTLTGKDTYKRVLWTVNFSNINKWSYCGYIGSGNNLCIGTRPTNLTRFDLGSAGSNTTNAYTLSTNTKYTYDLWMNASNNNNLTLLDESGNTLWTSSSLSATFSGNTGEIYIGAGNQNNAPVSFVEGKTYSFVMRQPSYNTIVFNGIPCQRKSDGVCGMYDTISGTFKPMVGTTITDAAAGPVVNEYWDLTA